MAQKKQATKRIPTSVLHHLDAAQGWVELGNAAEARHELDSIPKAFARDHAVLLVRCDIYEKESNWEQWQKTAKQVTQLYPDCLVGWLHLANAIRKTPGADITKAQKVLSGIYLKFPFTPMISYTRALCAAQLGNFELAEDMLDDAFTCARRDAEVIDRLAAKALEAPELKPIWRKIKPLAEFNKTH